MASRVCAHSLQRGGHDRMESFRKIFLNPWVLAAVVALGLAARFAAAVPGYANHGYNFDVNSWFIVADIARHGGNVYAETDRYNYGPVWFLVLHALDVLAGHREHLLRFLIVGCLSLADIGIFMILLRKAGGLAACLFFLNPVSILVTGYHGQFDNLAIGLGLWSVVLMGDDFAAPVKGRKLCGLLVLGLSITVKHVLFAFPFWLALKQKGPWQKLLVLLVPAACFLISFAPYWEAGREGIINHVFRYQSIPANWFYYGFVPSCIQNHVDGKTLWYGLLVLFAFICRTRNGFESLLIYTGVIVAFSPASTDEYLAIPIALASVFPSLPFAAYTAGSLLNLLGSLLHYRLGPAGADTISPLHGYFQLTIYCLCFALAWLLWKPKFLRLLQIAGQEVESQLFAPKEPRQDN